MEIFDKGELSERELKKRNEEVALGMFKAGHAFHETLADARKDGYKEWEIKYLLDDMGRLPKRMKNNEAMFALKRSLGLSMREPLPRCGHKSHRKVVALAAAGDVSHREKRHVCPKCKCDRIAGQGTKHLGYGMCWGHEHTRFMRSNPEHVAEITRKHKAALMTRNPQELITATDFRNEVAKEAQQSRAAIAGVNIIPSATVVSNILKNFYGLLNDYEKNDGFKAEALATLAGLRDDISRVGGIDAELGKSIADSLQKIEFKMRVPITERGGKEMSGEVRIKLVAETLQKLISAMKDLNEMLNVRSIPAEQFRIWLENLHKNMMEEFGTRTYVRDTKEIIKIMDGIAGMFVKTGDPTRAT